MKKITSVLISVLFSLHATSQIDTVRIKNTNYVSLFDTTKKYPVMVEWWVTSKMVTCKTPLKRKDNFKPDPQLIKQTDISKDYVGSGFDRGHMMPAADNLCQTPQIQDECFYFSNMAAQYHSLNAGDWKSLETLVREKAKTLDSIRVWAGNIGEIKKIGRVSVPKYCWKVIYIKRDNVWMSFLFENNQSKPNGIEDNKVSLKEIEKLTGFKFL